MSSTRRALPGTEQSDECYASDPLLSRGLKAGDVVRRCETLDDPAHIELALFLQYVSNLQGSLDKLTIDLLAAFPTRLGTSEMHLNPPNRDGHYGIKEVRAVRDGIPSIFNHDDFLTRGEWACDHWFDSDIFASKSEMEDRDRRRTLEGTRYPTSYPVSAFENLCREHFLAEVPSRLRRFCLDPNSSLDQLTLKSFQDLPAALLAYLDLWEKKTLSGLVITDIGEKVIEALEYAEQEKALVLVEGFARTGKTFIAKAWVAARPGRRRIVSLSEATSDKEFFQEIAKALGTAASLGFKANELRLRVNEVLRPGYLTLCIDEAHFLWPQRNLREASPRRIEWVRASLANYGVPVALVATHLFTRAQQVIEKNTHWSSEQLIGRIAYCAKLPDRLANDDIAAVVRYYIPEAEQRTVDFLVDYVIASKKRLAVVDHGVRAARHVARKEGRERLTHSDVIMGFQSTVIPSDRNLAAAAEVISLTAANTKRRPSKIFSAPQPMSRKPLSAPAPERDNGPALTVQDRQNNRSASASLSTA